tara:strand:+ start:1033 stop:1281 length:249 start_codon:yes stop_codon:yes gene_type:complete
MEDEKKGPGKLKKAKNFGKAVVKHVAGGCKRVSLGKYAERLSICNKCEYKKEDECIKCGCILSKKAWWATEDCPENKWPKLK